MGFESLRDTGLRRSARWKEDKKCHGMKLACRAEEEQSEAPNKKARTTKSKSKARATPMVSYAQIPGLVKFFGHIADSLQLLVKETCHTNMLLFNLGADVAKNTELIGDVKNLLYKIC